MPVVQTRPDLSKTAQTNDAWRAPHKTLLANTTSIKDMLVQPGAAGKPSTTELNPAPKEQIQAVTKTEENGQPNTIKEEPNPAAVTLSPQLTALARKEQAFRKQEQAFKTQQAEFKAKQEAFEKSQSEFSTLSKAKERLAANDYSVLDELGVSYEQYTNYLLNKGEGETPENKAITELRNELNGIKTQQEEQETKRKESIDKQYAETIKQYEKGIAELVAKDPEYDSIKEMKAEAHVLQHILDTFNEDGETLTIEQAAKEIEEFIEEDALAMSKLKKIQAKIQPPAEEKKQVLQPPKQALKTLTNQVAAQGSKTYPQFQHLSPKERIAQAIAKSQRQG